VISGKYAIDGTIFHLLQTRLPFSTDCAIKGGNVESKPNSRSIIRILKYQFFNPGEHFCFFDAGQMIQDNENNARKKNRVENK
jgi:hypothetical protein